MIFFKCYTLLMKPADQDQHVFIHMMNRSNEITPTDLNLYVLIRAYKDVYGNIFVFIIPHVNFPHQTSIDDRLIFYNITCCYSNGEYCHMFAIAAGDIIKYQGGHMMGNTYARMVRSRQETFNSNGGHDA